jgi:hypothetical protein
MKKKRLPIELCDKEKFDVDKNLSSISYLCNIFTYVTETMLIENKNRWAMIINFDIIFSKLNIEINGTPKYYDSVLCLLAFFLVYIFLLLLSKITYRS